MKFLELFSGTHAMADTFKAHGWETYTVDWDPETDADLHANIGQLVADDIIKLCHGVPDVIWASPDCTTYSVAAISKHRRQEGDDLVPVSNYARTCDMINTHAMLLIAELVEIPIHDTSDPVCPIKKAKRYYFVENPRGAFRKQPFLEALPDRKMYTVTYCQYGEIRQKPTDIFTNHPDPKFLPPCKPGAPCHVRAPRGSKTGTQGIKGKLNRARIPQALCEHIVEICEEE